MRRKTVSILELGRLVTPNDGVKNPDYSPPIEQNIYSQNLTLIGIMDGVDG